MAISKRIPSYIRRLTSRPVVFTRVVISPFMEHLAECSHCSSHINNPCLIGHSLILNAPVLVSKWPKE